MTDFRRFQNIRKGPKMATEHQLDRAQAIRNYGSHCKVCAIGPLNRRGLFVLPIGPNHHHIPLCKECHNHLKAGVTRKAIVQTLRRRANAMIEITREQATTGGYQVAPVPDDGHRRAD